MERIKYAVTHLLVRFRVTLMIISVLVTTTFTMLFVMHFFLGANLIESDTYEMLPDRPIDENSPVYKYAEEIAGDMYIMQCDGTPSVSVGSLKGYRILLMKNWDYHSGWRVRCKPFHKDMVLVPVNNENVPKLKQISWEKVEQQKRVDAVYMGQGHGYHWFGRMTTPEQDSIRKYYKLQGGDDRLKLLVKYVNRSKNREERRWALELLARHIGEQAIPVLRNEIEHNKNDCRIYAIHALGYIPHKEATDLLLSLYNNKENRQAVKSALLFPPYHEEAKQFYLDLLNPSRPEDNYFLQVLDVIQEYGWIESISLLEKHMEKPYNAEQYIECCKAIRSLNNNPIPEELTESEETITLMDTWMVNRQPSPDEVEKARENIKNHKDIEGALLISLSLATVTGTFRNLRRPNEIGVELLCELPRDKVLPVLEHLSANIRDIRSRDKIIAIMATVLAFENSPPEIPHT